MIKKVKQMTVRQFMLKKFPTNKYMDCPVPKHHWEIIQEYADEYHKSKVKNLSSNTKLSDGWISVKDQLPEFNLPVLVCQAGDESSVEICRLESKTERKDSVSHEWVQGKTSYDSSYYDVTHWMPLPTCR